MTIAGARRFHRGGLLSFEDLLKGFDFGITPQYRFVWDHEVAIDIIADLEKFQEQIFRQRGHGKSMMYFSLRQLQLMQVRLQIDSVNQNVRSFLHRIAQRNVLKAIRKGTKDERKQQQQQWRKDERRRSRQHRPGRL